MDILIDLGDYEEMTFTERVNTVDTTQRESTMITDAAVRWATYNARSVYGREVRIREIMER